MCDHDWKYVHDWEGDPSVPNGTRDISYYECTLCGETQDEVPDGFDLTSMSLYDTLEEYNLDRDLCDRDCDYWERVS